MSLEETLSPNWDEFSFEEELEARKLQSRLFIEQLQMEVQEKNSKTSCPVEDNVKIMEGQIVQIQNKYEDLETHCKNLKTGINDMLKKIDGLKKEKLEIEYEMKTVLEKLGAKEEYKLHKHAYNAALQKYQTYFDLVINITHISDDIFKAYVKFQAFIDMRPIKVTINRKQRKIIEFDATELLTQEELNALKDSDNHLVNFPAFLSRIRQHLITNNILK